MDKFIVLQLMMMKRSQLQKQKTDLTTNLKQDNQSEKSNILTMIP